MGCLECSRLQRMFWNVLGKGWVGWNEKLRTERVMSIEEGEMAFPERGCDVGWDGQTGPNSWARTWAYRGCEGQWGGAAHLEVGELGS